jgi:hypothetical protein
MARGSTPTDNNALPRAVPELANPITPDANARI